MYHVRFPLVFLSWLESELMPVETALMPFPCPGLVGDPWEDINIRAWILRSQFLGLSPVRRNIKEYFPRAIISSDLENVELPATTTLEWVVEEDHFLAGHPHGHTPGKGERKVHSKSHTHARTVTLAEGVFFQCAPDNPGVDSRELRGGKYLMFQYKGILEASNARYLSLAVLKAWYSDTRTLLAKEGFDLNDIVLVYVNRFNIDRNDQDAMHNFCAGAEGLILVAGDACKHFLPGLLHRSTRSRHTVA
jgi:hypothetical protein